MIILLLTGAAVAQADTSYQPGSRLDRPMGKPPVFLMGHLSLNGTASHGIIHPGYGLSFLFRPQAASEFFDFMYDLNTSLVLQADYQRVDQEGRRILSGDFIVRCYEHDMRQVPGRNSAFLGAGFGGSEITEPSGSGVRTDIWFSFLLEGGYEWSHGPGLVVVTKLQFRYYDHANVNYSGFSGQIHVGIPVPW